MSADDFIAISLIVIFSLSFTALVIYYAVKGSKSKSERPKKRPTLRAALLGKRIAEVTRLGDGAPKDKCAGAGDALLGGLCLGPLGALVMGLSKTRVCPTERFEIKYEDGSSEILDVEVGCQDYKILLGYLVDEDGKA